MEAGRLTRFRWRHRGAWLWPSFIALTLLDGVIGHALPPAGDSQHFLGAALVGCFANLIGIVALAWPVSLAVRRYRRGMPEGVARDYAGTLVMASISALVLLLGILHHSALAQARQARAEAMARAEAWIGARAPAEFRARAASLDAYEIQPGSIYRVCVLSARGRSYCVVVDTSAPLARSVRFAGYESNAVYSEGAQ